VARVSDSTCPFRSVAKLFTSSIFKD
jgi:hypothetical protein